MRGMTKIVLFVFVCLTILVSGAEAGTAVTISVESGAALTESGLEAVDLAVPQRPAEAMPLQVGDKVFFEGYNLLLVGEGTITDVYEVEGTAEENGIEPGIVIEHIPVE